MHERTGPDHDDAERYWRDRILAGDVAVGRRPFWTVPFVLALVAWLGLVAVLWFGALLDAQFSCPGTFDTGFDRSERHACIARAETRAATGALLAVPVPVVVRLLRR